MKVADFQHEVLANKEENEDLQQEISRYDLEICKLNIQKLMAVNLVNII